MKSVHQQQSPASLYCHILHTLRFATTQPQTHIVFLYSSVFN